MTANGDREGPQPIDPDFAGLFRPTDDPVPDPAPQPRTTPPPAANEPSPAPEQPRAQTPPAAADEPAPARTPGPPVDTGRLFRSQGASDHPDAVLALSSDHFGRLRTLKRDKGDGDAPAPADAMAPAPLPEEAVHALVAAGTASPVVDPAAASGIEAHHGVGNGVEQGDVDVSRGHRGPRSRAIRAGAVYVIVIGVTVLVGFANALLSGGALGWPTGVALVISSVYAALTVRRQDDVVAFLTPPVAFFLAALTAGQVFIDSLEGSVLNRAVILFFTLAENWIWIIGATLAALVIVLVRRRRS